MAERYDKDDKTAKVSEDSNGFSKTGTVLRTQRTTSGAGKEDFSAAALKRLSDIRKGQIQEVLEKKTSTNRHDSPNYGVIGIASNPKRRMEADIKRAIETTPSLKKMADSGVAGDFSIGNISSSGKGVDRAIPEIYSPLFQVANLNLPRDRMTMNAWNRNFFDTHPIVRNAITLHATYPISKINVKCKHRKVEQFFNDMAERIDLFDAIAGVAFEFWKMGEAFPYAELDETNGIWSSIVIQNPDYVTVKKSGVSNIPIISLRPDEVLKKVVTSNHPADIKLRSQIPDNIVHHIRKNEPIPLDNFNVSHLKMLSSPYDVRGTSIIVSCYKDLMLYDKLRECKFAQADSLVNPITLISVGGSGEGEFHPSDAQLEAYRQIFEEAQWDKDFKIVTHAAVKVERVGASGAILDTQNDFNFIRENLYAGLMVPKSIMDTEGTAYASASVGLEVLRTRYITFRNMLEKWLEKKIFAPISQIQGFFEYRNGEKVLIVPEIDWNHINLYDLNDYIQALGAYVEKSQISVHTLYRSLGLNWEEEQRLIREEMVRGAIMAKEQGELKKMGLVELRALDPDEPIVEGGEEEMVPGEMPGEPGAPGMDLGGAPPMPDLGGGPPAPGGPPPEVPGAAPPGGPPAPGGEAGAPPATPAAPPA